MIASALTLGAATALKPVAEQAVKDAYEAVRSLIKRRYERVDLSGIERKPESEAKRRSLAEDLSEAKADQDAELLNLIKTLTEVIDQHAPDVGRTVGIDLADVKARSLAISDVQSDDDGVRVARAEFTEDIDISGIRASSRKGTDTSGADSPRNRR